MYKMGLWENWKAIVNPTKSKACSHAGSWHMWHAWTDIHSYTPAKLYLPFYAWATIIASSYPSHPLPFSLPPFLTRSMVSTSLSSTPSWRCCIHSLRVHMYMHTKYTCMYRCKMGPWWIQQSWWYKRMGQIQHQVSMLGPTDSFWNDQI